MSAISFPNVAEAVQARAVAATQKRWLALDLLRFLAVVLMVQGHTFTALVSDHVRHLDWYRWHDFIHGYTAPLFMFSAGLAFGVTTLRGWSKQSVWGPAVKKRLFRYLLIVAIGYALQLPGGRLWPVFTGMSDGSYHRLWAVNALQVIGVTLLLVQLLALVVRRRGALVATSAALGAVVVGGAPWFWQSSGVAALPVPLAGFLTDQTGSIFPIFPWSGFIFAGIVTAWLVGDVSSPERRAQIAPWLAVAGGALATAAFAFDHLGVHPYEAHNFWKTCPWFFLWRVGCILPVLGAFGVFEQWRAGRRAHLPDGPVLRTARVLGQESLVIYVGHLVLLYGFMLPFSMNGTWSHALDLGHAIVAVLALFALMIVLGRVWHHVKTERPSQFDVVRWTLGLGTLGVLLLRG